MELGGLSPYPLAKGNEEEEESTRAEEMRAW